MITRDQYKYIQKAFEGNGNMPDYSSGLMGINEIAGVKEKSRIIPEEKYFFVEAIIKNSGEYYGKSFKIREDGIPSIISEKVFIKGDALEKAVLEDAA